MDLQIALLLILAMVALLLIGVPVAYSMLLTGAIGIYLVGGYNLLFGLLRTAPINTVASFSFATIPLFVLMAMYLKNCGLATDVFRALDLWLTKIPAGLALSTVFANGMMAVLSGSSVANAAAMSKIAVPEMDKHDYDRKLSVGTVTAAGTFALLFPPSLALIIYGILTDESIAVLFIAGITPGLITLFLYIVLILIWYKLNPNIAGKRVEEVTWKQRGNSLRKIWPAIFLAVIVLGGLYGGVFTAAEAGAIGAVGALLVAIQQKITVSKFYSSLKETIEITAMVFMLIIGAIVFGRFLTLTGMTEFLVETITNLPLGETGIIIMFLIFLLIMGMLMSQTAVLVLTVPLLFPVVVQMGIDPIWFGIFMVKTVEMGLITPPFGVIIFVVSGSIDVDVLTIYKGAMPFFLMDLVVIGLLIYSPRIVTYLPNMMA